MAFVLALFALTTIAMALTSALLVASSDIRATRNYREASQVHFVAESAIAHAMQVVNGPGVVNFQNDVVTPWGALFGTGARTFGPVGGYTYTVSSFTDPVDVIDLGSLVATSTGPEGVRNVVVARVRGSNIPSTAPGAIYLSQNGQTNATFNGNGFTIDGNDHLLTGGLANPNHPIPGLSTRNDTNTQEAINSLSTNQRNDVIGLGYIAGSPSVPSILTSPAAPTPAQLNQLATDLLARPGVVSVSDTEVHGTATFGTEAQPQITYFNNAGGITIKANGNSSGAGVMIVEGDLTIQGDLNFKGLILVRGKTSVQVTDVIGNATVYGSLWTQDIDLVVGGSAIVDYSTQALALANQVAGGHALPSPLKVISMADCGMMPSGVGGCP